MFVVSTQDRKGQCILIPCLLSEKDASSLQSKSFMTVKATVAVIHDDVQLLLAYLTLVDLVSE